MTNQPKTAAEAVREGLDRVAELTASVQRTLEAIDSDDLRGERAALRTLGYVAASVADVRANLREEIANGADAPAIGEEDDEIDPVDPWTAAEELRFDVIREEVDR